MSNAGELARVSRASLEESKFDTRRNAIAAPKIDKAIQANLEVSSILSANSETIALDVVPSDRNATQRADWNIIVAGIKYGAKLKSQKNNLSTLCPKVYINATKNDAFFPRKVCKSSFK